MVKTALLAAALAAAVSAAPAGAQAGTAPRPNVVLIITDDVGYGDFGVYGAPDVRTPHVDGLARDGVRLTDFYANGATCTPTRAGLISGRYQQRFTLELPLGSQGGTDLERGLAPTGGSLPRLLKNSGYATALIGKWHLGWKSEFSPAAHGFDHFFGFKSGFIDYYRHTDGEGRPDLFENDVPVQVPGYTTDLVTERSVRFIEQNAGRPFFLDVSYSAAHWPYQVPDRPSTARDRGRHLGPFDDSTSTRADYVAVLERADQGVGRILATLDRLGLRRNTLVIFTNDNGGEWLSRNTPLFHHKGSLWEGGIRVPAILRWPGRIPAGSVSGQVGITMDLTASILAATGTAVPPGARHEGIDLLPVLEGRAPEIDRTLFWRLTAPRPQQAVRSGDWKLLLDGGRPMLFDLRTDVGERENLIARRPDVARRLRPLLAAWQEDVDSEAKGRRLAGRTPARARVEGRTTVRARGGSLLRTGDRLLVAGGALTGAAALLHLGIILGGPDWYRFFGAGERMARLAARGSIYPSVITAAIAAVLGVWALYALSGAGVIRRLPLLRPVLALVAAVYLARGILGVPAVLLIDDPYASQLRAKMTFMVVSSALCVLLGLCYAVGAAGVWKTRGR